MGGDREKMRIRELTRTERAKIRKLVTESCANYGSREKQCIPLDCPCYMLDKCWTGSLCRYFQEAVLGAGTQAAGASGKGELVRSLAEKRQRFQGFQGPVHRAAKEEYAYLAKQG